MMTGITGAHMLLYSDKPEADRAFFRDVLGFRAVDAGEGWLIFALPPAEAGIHPSDGISGQLHGGRHLLGAVLYVRRLGCAHQILAGQECHLLTSRRSTLGNKNDHPVAQRRRDRPLPAHASDSIVFLSAPLFADLKGGNLNSRPLLAESTTPRGTFQTSTSSSGSQ